MKRIISLILILIGLSGVSAEAQNFFSQDDDNQVMNDGPKVFVSMGPTIGLTMATISIPSDASYSFGYRPGITAGGFLNFRFLERNIRSTAETGVLAVQPEIRFTMIGGNSDNSDLGLSYVMVPVMFQVYPLANLYLEAGPVFGFNLEHTPDNIVIYNRDEGFIVSQTEYNLESLRANDVAAAFGIGYRFRNLGIAARYNLGLSDLAANMPWKNRWFEVGISYSIPMTKKHSMFD